MRLSLSLPIEDVAFLDEYARQQGLTSRSAAVRRAIRMLRVAGLADAYQAAWEEWTVRGAAGAWEPTVNDGWVPVPRGDRRTR